MKLELINNKAIMNIGLINVNYNANIQLDHIKPKVDSIIYFDNSDMLNILEYIRDNDNLLIYSYTFLNDNPKESLRFKENLKSRNVILKSIIENTLDYSNAVNDLTFNLMINVYEYYKLIDKYRIK